MQSAPDWLSKSAGDKIGQKAKLSKRKGANIAK